MAATPAFFGANPARVEKGPKAGLRVLGAEEDLARSLLASLDARQRRSAVISTTAPSDILLRPGRRSVPSPEGLPAGEMTAGQKAALRKLVDEYLGNMREDVARAQREKIEKAGVDAIRFAWAGGDQPGQGHYYRLQGPTFLIEYDNTQDGRQPRAQRLPGSPGRLRRRPAGRSLCDPLSHHASRARLLP